MYYKDIEMKVRVAYTIAKEARNKGLDSVDRVEIPLATDLPERVTGLVSTLIPQIKDERIEKRIRALEKEHGFLNPAVAFTIADEIASEKFSKFSSKLEAIEAGVRVGFAYLTLGSVSSPLEGFTRIKLKKNEEGEFFSVFYSGPIRSAGGTAAAVSVVLVDHLRERFGYARYKTKENFIQRAVAEVYDYHERATNLQYLPSEKEIEVLAENLPVQINGDPTEDFEVSNHKTVEDIETPKIRGGFCLVMAECLAQKAAKLQGIIAGLREKGFPLKEWDFLEKVVAIQKKKKGDGEKKEATYIKDLVAGRPIFSHPSANGGFRLRYGRGRTSGLSAVSLHPALSYLLNDFIAVGTQFRMEKPGKSAAITFCDTIDGPIIKLDDGRVLKIKGIEEAKKFAKRVQEIIYLGDILISYGDFYNRNHPLLPCGYNEEYWLAEAKEQKVALGKNAAREISLDDAIKLSEDSGLALHPEFIFYWKSINPFQLRGLLKWLLGGKINDEIILPIKEHEEEKRALELIGCPHIVVADKVVIKEDARALLYNLGFLGLGREEMMRKADGALKMIDESHEDSLSIADSLCASKIRDKCGTFIGARMGRPEKAKPRKLTGSPNVLFPVGNQGGRLRSFQEAMHQGKVFAEFPIYFCEECSEETIYYMCEKCGKATRRMAFCEECKQRVDRKCLRHGKAELYTSKSIDIKHYFDAAKNKLNLSDAEIPPLVKGVRGTSSASHIVENLAKGILRAAYGLSVNKDGTIRVDLTELPLTHFKPAEVLVTVERLRELGYTKDVYGKELKDDNQILELKPHDIVVPICPESLDERIDEFFVKIAAFIDNLLVRFYGLRPFYNARTRDDLVGQLVVALSPHTSVGVVGRIIGFSSVQALYAHPLMHAALRRDADGDEAALMLLLDCLMNFSHYYLPAHRGSTQDAPLILNARIKATEVDDMAFDIETCDEYPLDLYIKAEQFASPREVKVPQIRHMLDGDIKGVLFTHDTTSINAGVTCSAYKKLETMEEKVAKQMDVAHKIRAVDEDDVARLIIERHFIRDIRGNMRKFSSQQFRCSKCNEKFRRPPLMGTCTECGGNIIFTVSEGGIVKYLDSALSLAENYNVSPYVKQSMDLLKKKIESVFGKEKEKQVALEQWMR